MLLLSRCRVRRAGQGNDESAGVCRDGMEMEVFGVVSEVGVVVAIR